MLLIGFTPFRFNIVVSPHHSWTQHEIISNIIYVADKHPNSCCYWHTLKQNLTKTPLKKYNLPDGPAEANDEVATAAAAAVEVAAVVAETATEAAASVTSVVVEGCFGPVTRAVKPADSPTTSAPDRRQQHEVAAEVVEEAVEAAAAVVDDRPAVVAG